MSIMLRFIFLLSSLGSLLSSCATPPAGTENPLSDNKVEQLEFIGTLATAEKCEVGIECGYHGYFGRAQSSLGNALDGFFMRDKNTKECILIVMDEPQISEFEEYNQKQLLDGDLHFVKGVEISSASLSMWNDTPLCDGVDIATRIFQYQSIETFIIFAP